MSRTKDETKRLRIIEAAVDIFSQKGFHEATLEDVARKSKVGKGTIYLYFTSKEDLLASLFHEEMNRVLSKAEEKSSGIKDFSKEMKNTLTSISGYFILHPKLTRLFLVELNHLMVYTPEKEKPPGQYILLDFIQLKIDRIIAAGLFEYKGNTRDLGAFILGGFKHVILIHLKDLESAPARTAVKLKNEFSNILNDLLLRTTLQENKS